MAEFKNGDPVYHARHGAGTVVDIREVAIGGTPGLYYEVALASGSQLMIPVGQDGPISTLSSSKAINEVLISTPEKLKADYRNRRMDIEQKINSGDQLQSAEVFRDLTWRDHHAYLTDTDKKFMDSMKKRLIGILSIQKGVNVQEAAQWLEKTVKEITGSWAGPDGDGSEAS